MPFIKRSFEILVGVSLQMFGDHVISSSTTQMLLWTVPVPPCSWETGFRRTAAVLWATFTVCLCACVCVCAFVAEKASSRQNSGRRCTADALGMKCTTLFWKKAHFLLNMKERASHMLLSMRTKSMFPSQNGIKILIYIQFSIM